MSPVALQISSARPRDGEQGTSAWQSKATEQFEAETSVEQGQAIISSRDRSTGQYF